MAINLQKGQKIDLTKSNPGLKDIMVGLGWDAAENKGGLMGLFAGKPADIDCDASVLMLDSNGRITSKDDVVYFGKLKHSSGSVEHMGDNLTGDGDGDDECIFVRLDKVPQNVHKLVFVVNIYQCRERNQHFGMIKNAFIRLVNKAANQEICHYNLSEPSYDGKTAVIFGEIYRHNGEWKFSALDIPTTDASLTEIVRRYQI